MEARCHVRDGKADHDRHQDGDIFETVQSRSPVGVCVTPLPGFRNGWKADVAGTIDFHRELRRSGKEGGAFEPLAERQLFENFRQNWTVSKRPI